jgi:hypothetical protein
MLNIQGQLSPFIVMDWLDAKKITYLIFFLFSNNLEGCSLQCGPSWLPQDHGQIEGNSECIFMDKLIHKGVG